MTDIEITGACKHNLKNISLRLPKRRLIAITGVSGSGKSSLALDTLFREGQRKYLESLSIYARQFIKSMERPQVQSIKGISPTIAIDQKHSSYYYNSTAGTISEISPYLRLLFARVAHARCPGCGKNIEKYSPGTLSQYIFDTFKDQSVAILAPVVKNRRGQYAALFEKYVRRGFLKALVDGTLHYLEDLPELNRFQTHYIAIQVDSIKIADGSRNQLEESLALAAFESDGEIIVRRGEEEYFFSNKLYCPACNISLREPQPATFSLNSPAAVCAACKGRGEDGGRSPCLQCVGSGYNREALSFYFKGKNIYEIGCMEAGDLLPFLKSVSLSPTEQSILRAVLPNIISRLEVLVRLNLGYISLNRKLETLSGGELQRTRLVSQIGSSLSGIIYILDEPSIGLHMSEQENLVELLKRLTEKGNTVVVVEHDEYTIRSSDYIVDLGPGSGARGGEVVYAGAYSDMPQAKTSLTARYLFSRPIHPPLPPRRESPGMIWIKGVTINNVHEQDFNFPLNALTVVTGVSGSGKSSLAIDAVYPILRSHLHSEAPVNPRFSFRSLEGADSLTRVNMVTQSAIGRSARSCPATYIGVMPVLRQLFAGLAEAKIRGYDSGRFSFNLVGGRCDACSGLGIKTLEMNFLPELEIPCPVCGGSRYNSETLMIRYNHFSIADILAMTADLAYQQFRNIPDIARRVKMLIDVGLGYLQLGQGSTTLSGGESQRIKLCRELTQSATQRVLFILDEPTVGLHFDDIRKLIDVFHALIAAGNTVLVIEHNPEIIRVADYVTDMGPGGGRLGGRILYQGPLKGLFQIPDSVTGACLKRLYPEEIS